MIYVAWYLGMGVVVLVSIALSHKLTKKMDPESLSAFSYAVDPDRKKLWHVILNYVGIPALLVPFWPVLIIMKVKEIFSKKTDSLTQSEPKFAVARGDLLEQVSIQEEEQREKIIDPMGAVSDLAFGHLHAAWKQFLEEVEPQDEIWMFSAQWTFWGRKELRGGYVIVRGDIIGLHFMTSFKDFD